MEIKIDLQKFNLDKLKECPFCGCKIFYTKYRVEGTSVYRFRNDGKEVDNEDMYSCLNQTGGKRVYCNNCNSYLGNAETNKISSSVLSAIEERDNNEDKSE